jgi:glutathione synthase
VPKLTKIDPASRALLYSPPHSPNQEIEITTVYFRAGYGPDDYPTENEWAARLLLERSRAIKCPTVATQLAGSKKVQQVLAAPGILESFTPDSTTAARLRHTFAAIYPLDTSPEGLKARQLAFEQPEKYVLKPQREGGGNNIYRTKIPGFLNEIGEAQWPGYILMELIEPPPVEGVIFREGRVLKGGVIGELGVYGAVIWDTQGKVVENKECGWLLRTKGSESEEGGVAAGFGCVDGVCLVD